LITGPILNPRGGFINDFFKIVKAGFSAKRKKLANNLSAGLKIAKLEALALLD